MFHFYTPWKHQKMGVGGYRSGTLLENGLAACTRILQGWFVSNDNHNCQLKIKRRPFISFRNSLRLIHLMCTQNFPWNKHFLPPDTHTYLWKSESKKYYFFGKFCVHTTWMIPCMIWFFFRILCSKLLLKLNPLRIFSEIKVVVPLPIASLSIEVL